MEDRVIRLKNGLRVALVKCEAESVAVGMIVQAGSRDEKKHEAGVSHFIEHMLFKGTAKRSAIEISRAIEGRGGSFNACTSEEITAYYIHLPFEYLGEALDILSDMYTSALMAEDELERERCVILQELDMYNDDPANVASETLQAIIFPGHPLGRPVGGTIKSVNLITREMLMASKKSRYVPANTIIAIAGNFELDTAERLVGDYFGSIRNKKPAITCRNTPLPVKIGEKMEEKLYRQDIQQAQIAMGFRMFGNQDERRFAARILDTLLGTGMSSRLFVSIREKHALSYDISSHIHFFSDSGMFSITAGVGKENLRKTIKLIDSELKRTIDKKIPEKELKRIKELITGSMRLGEEKVTSKMFNAGLSLLIYDRLFTREERIERLLAVSTEDVMNVARDIFTEQNRELSLVIPSGEDRDEMPF